MCVPSFLVWLMLAFPLKPDSTGYSHSAADLVMGAACYTARKTLRESPHGAWGRGNMHPGQSAHL